MPGPALPAWAIVVVGLAAAAVAAIVTYFVTSSKAKARSAKFHEKILRICEALETKLELLEARLRRAEAERDAAREAARRAEEEKAEATAEARRERKRARRAEAEARELKRKIKETREELEKWRAEAVVAARLEAIAGAELTKALLVEVRDINATSSVLGGRLPRPKKAMALLDNVLAETEETNAAMEESVESLDQH